MTEYTLEDLEFIKQKRMKKLRSKLFIIFTLSLWTMILASLPRAVAQQEARYKPHVEPTATQEPTFMESLKTSNPVKPEQSTASEKKDKKTELVEMTCYTAVESKGANGREYGISIATYRYPKGTWVEIEGVGKRRVDTVTAKRLAHRVDIWMTPAECAKWGKQMRNVTIL